MRDHVSNENSLQNILEHLEQLSKSLTKEHRGPSFQNQALEIKIQLEKIYERINTKRDQIVLSLDNDFQTQKAAYAAYLAQEEAKKIRIRENELTLEAIAKSEEHFKSKNYELIQAINTMKDAIHKEDQFALSLGSLSIGTGTGIKVDRSKTVEFPSTAIIQEREYRIRLMAEFAKTKRLELFGSLEQQLLEYQARMNAFERKVVSLQLGYAYAFVANLTITVIIDPIGANVTSDWVLRVTDNNAYNLVIYHLGKIPEYPIVLGRGNPDKFYEQYHKNAPILDFIQFDSERGSWNGLTEFEIFSDNLKLTVPLTRVNVEDF